MGAQPPGKHLDSIGSADGQQLSCWTPKIPVGVINELPSSHDQAGNPELDQSG
jgi:hypothetical protein